MVCVLPLANLLSGMKLEETLHLVVICKDLRWGGINLPPVTNKSHIEVLGRCILWRFCKSTTR